jgi:hypothetical protein
MEPLPDVALLDGKIADATSSIEKAESTSDKRNAKERKEDLMRLKRVEQIYVSTQKKSAQHDLNRFIERCPTRSGQLGSCVAEAFASYCFSKR